MRPRVIAIGVLLALLPSCRGERPAPPSRTQTPAQGTPLAAGTVGAAVEGYHLDMPKVRRWYAVMHELRQVANADSTFHFALQAELDSPLAQHVAAVEAEPRVRDVAARHGLKPREFVVLTAAVVTMRMSLYFVDSLGESGRPVNVGSAMLGFARANRAALDSLEAAP